MCALGLTDSLRGVSRYCVYPPEVVARLPKLGDCINPSYESILRLKPSVVLIGDMQVEAAVKLKSLGIPFLTFGQSRLSDVYDAFTVLGKRFNCEKRADSIVNRLKSELDSLKGLSAHRPVKRVFFVVGRNPGTLSNLYTINGKSFLSELLRIAGGVSIFDSMSMVWCKVSAEEVILRDPEVIIETALMGNGSEGADAWKRLPNITAVKNGHIHTLREDYIFTPGPRMVETAKRLSGILAKP